MQDDFDAEAVCALMQEELEWELQELLRERFDEFDNGE